MPPAAGQQRRLQRRRGVVYINRDMAAADQAKAAQTFVEEAGHHLDATLNRADTKGDEGEMFRRVLAGEQLSTQEISAIRNENDHGTVTLDGKKVEVEFWSFDPIGWAGDVGGALVDGAAKVGGALVDGAQQVGGALVDGAKQVGGALVDGANTVGGAIETAQGPGHHRLGSTPEEAKDAGSAIVGGVSKAGRWQSMAPRRSLEPPDGVGTIFMARLQSSSRGAGRAVVGLWNADGAKWAGNAIMTRQVGCRARDGGRRVIDGGVVGRAALGVRTSARACSSTPSAALRPICITATSVRPSTPSCAALTARYSSPPNAFIPAC